MEIFLLQITLLSSFPPLPSLRAEYPLFLPTGQHNGKKVRPEHPGRKPGLVPEPGGGRDSCAAQCHGVSAAPRRVMNPKWPPFTSQEPKPAGCWTPLLPAPAFKWLFRQTITLRKAQSPPLLPGAFGCKLAKYVRVSRTTKLFIGNLNTAKGRGLARRVKFNKLHFRKVQGKVIFKKKSSLKSAIWIRFATKQTVILET